MKRSCLSLVAYLLVVGLGTQALQAQSTPRLWLIGDSTVNNNVNGGVGWGNVVQDKFDATVVNRALAGRSSRTFYSQSQFQGRVEGFPTQFGGPIDPGDFLIMQFGHNDGGTPAVGNTSSLSGIGENTVTVGAGTANEEVVHSFGWYLRWFIDRTRSLGAIPIVASFVPRAGNTDPVATSSNAQYALWAKQVADATGAAFLDLYGPVTQEYNALRAANPSDPNYIRNTHFGPDATHTNTVGAQLNADFVERGIQLGLGGVDGASSLNSLLKNPANTVPEPSGTLLFGSLCSAAYLLRRYRRRERI